MGEATLKPHIKIVKSTAETKTHEIEIVDKRRVLPNGLLYYIQIFEHKIGLNSKNETKESHQRDRGLQ